MQITLDFTLDCELDLAWWALRSTRVFTSLYGPLVKVVSAEPLPELWQSGVSYTVAMRGFGRLPMGSQVICPQLSDSAAGATPHARDAGHDRRVCLHDSGAPISGPLALLTGWDHRMELTAVGEQQTRWRDHLRVSGPAALPLSPVLWCLWHARQARLPGLIPQWRQWRADAQDSMAR